MPKRTFREEHKRKIGESLKGRKLSKSHKKALSESHMGQKAWNKGLKLVSCSEETKKRMSDSHKGKKFSKEHIKNIKMSAIGRKMTSLSDEHKLKISVKNSGKTPWSKGKKLTDEQKEKKRRTRLENIKKGITKRNRTPRPTQSQSRFQ